MHDIRVLLWFGGGTFCQYPSVLLHWHGVNLKWRTPNQKKQSWRKWINASQEFAKTSQWNETHRHDIITATAFNISLGSAFEIATMTVRFRYFCACLDFQNPLMWRHNKRHGVSNHQRLYYLLNRLFRHTPKKISKLCVTGFCEGNPPVTGDSPNKEPVTRQCFHLMT